MLDPVGPRAGRVFSWITRSARRMKNGKATVAASPQGRVFSIAGIRAGKRGLLAGVSFATLLIASLFTCCPIDHGKVFFLVV